MDKKQYYEEMSAAAAAKTARIEGIAADVEFLEEVAKRKTRKKISFKRGTAGMGAGARVPGNFRKAWDIYLGDRLIGKAYRSGNKWAGRYINDVGCPMIVENIGFGFNTRMDVVNAILPRLETDDADPKRFT